MSEIVNLLDNYRRHVSQPWGNNLAGAEKVWFAVYEPNSERRLRLRIQEFQIATQQAGHDWSLLDLTDSFAHWMANHRYREAYFEDPDDMALALSDYAEFVAAMIRDRLTLDGVSDNTVVALLGVGTLFGLAHISSILEHVVSDVPGRLLVFFPGQVNGSNYRLLDARDGWNYLAIPITAEQG